MTIIRTTRTTTAGTNLTLAAGEGLYVAAGALVASSGGDAIDASSADHDIRIAGEVFGADDGLILGTAPESISSLWIAPGGIVAAVDVAIECGGDLASITNHGAISGWIGIFRDGPGDVDLVNTGTVSGGANALGLSADSVRVVNEGTITSDITAINIRAWGSGSSWIAELVNEGLIRSRDSAAYFSVARTIGGPEMVDSVFNHGEIVGQIFLGGGDDLYDGRGGRVSGLRGYVRGGNDDDMLIAGDNGDQFFGDAGRDTLEGGAGADRFYGDQDEDTLSGGGGRDLLDGGLGADSLDGGEGDDILRGGAGADAIEGGGGARDLLDYAAAIAVSVNLGTGDASGGDAAGDVFSGIEWLGGGGANDTLTGDGGANWLFGREGNDLLNGGLGGDGLVGDAGADTLIGGAGVDVLRGGSGADVFRFTAASQSGAPGQLRDRVVDFAQAEADRIDLAGIDANTAVADDQAFAFRGAAAFTAAGQVRAAVINGNTFVFANTDADTATVEFSLVVVGAVTLTAADFIL